MALWSDDSSAKKPPSHSASCFPLDQASRLQYNDEALYHQSHAGQSSKGPYLALQKFAAALHDWEPVHDQGPG